MAGVKRSLGDVLDLDEALRRSSRSRANSLRPELYSQPRSATLNDSTPDSSRRRSQPDSLDTVIRTPSPTFPPLAGEVPEFGSDASVLLVGLRGAGKSTLAIMASSAMHRKVIDLETSFQRVSGMSSASFKSQHGSAACYKQQAKILQTALDRSRTGCILVCSWMESRIQSLLRDFAATNPVIHILRDAEAIQQHLKFPDSDKIQGLLGVSSAIFRSCTNFEFFNVSEKKSDPSRTLGGPGIRGTPAPYLTLKHAERHFLKFLSLIFPPGAIPFIESAFPLTLIPVEQRWFTYAASIPLSDVLDKEMEVENHVIGADVVQIAVHDLDGKSDASSGPMTTERATNIMGDIAKGIGIVRKNTVLPIILHLFLPHTASEDVVRVYLDLVNHVVRLCPEMMTVDLRLDNSNISQILKSRKRTKIIGNYFMVDDPSPWDSPMWLSFYKRANMLGCHLARLLRPAVSIEDNFTIAHLRSAVAVLKGPKIPLIAYNSGPLGRNSATFNPTLTVVSPNSLDRVNPKPPITPFITAVEATRALFSSFIYDAMKLYVFGAKVDYSLSPAMHNTALSACGIPHVYRPVSTPSLSGVKDLIEDPNFGGASIGLPFKVEAITLTDSLSTHARAIGAVNTLIPIRQLNSDGSIPEPSSFFQFVNKTGPIKALYGENTDWVGIRACIRRGLSPVNAVGPNTCGLVIGAGGMARATVYAMLQVGIQNILIHNRTVENAEKLVSHFTHLLEKKDFKLLSGGTQSARFGIIQSRDDPLPSDFRLPTVIISCIPTHTIGDNPAPDFTVPEPWLGSRTGGVVVELGYKYLDTPLLAQVRKEAGRGWVTLDGLDLLPEQGFAQFELFTGRRAPRRVMRREVFQAYRDSDGKSHLAELRPRLQSMEDQAS